jgi:hypothetical protein
VRRLAGSLVVPAAILLTGLLTPSLAAAYNPTKIRSFDFAVATTQAGTNPDVDFSAAFCTKVGDQYCPGSEFDERVKQLTVRLPEGLTANPTVVPKCPLSVYRSGGSCPQSVIGSVTATYVLSAGAWLQPPVAGNVYLLETQGSELGRIGYEVIVGNPIRFESSVRLADNRALEIGSETDLSLVNQIRIAIVSLSVHVNGSVNGVPFLTNPTSCGAATATLSALAGLSGLTG